MKQVQEMSQESNAIQNDEFSPTSFTIEGCGIFCNLQIDSAGRDEDVVVDSQLRACDLAYRQIDVLLHHFLGLHLIARHNVIVTDQGNLQVPKSTRLQVSRIVRLQWPRSFPKPS